MNGRLAVSLIEVGLSMNDHNVLVESMTFAETSPKEQKKKKEKTVKQNFICSENGKQLLL